MSIELRESYVYNRDEPAEFEQALRDKGAYYHIHHPYHVAMLPSTPGRFGAG